MNSRLLKNTLMKNWKKGSFNIPNPLLVCFNIVYKEKIWFVSYVHRLSRIESTYHKKLVPFTNALKATSLVKSCQGVHQD